MINLRFHIVSIVAVFLALAIGLLTGVALLDRATVDVLKASQERLDSRNATLRARNDVLRSSVGERGDANVEFGEVALSPLVAGQLDEDPVIILATRGIDEVAVRALQSTIRDAGASPLGVVWFDERFDLGDSAALGRVAEVVDVDPDQRESAVRSDIVESIAGPLSVVAESRPSRESDANASTTTTTAIGPDPTTTTTPVDESDDVDAARSVLSELVDADLVDWESPTDGEPGSRLLPESGLRIIVLSGEGASVRASRFVYPLARALAAQRPGVIVGEVRNIRTDLEVVDEEGVPQRGAFVDELRDDGDVAEQMITVDNVDEPFGVLAVIFALADLPASTSGRYGMAESADRVFPDGQR